MALSEVLQLRVEVIECRADALPTYTLAEHVCELPRGARTPTVHLLRRGLHYHLLLPASPIGERFDDGEGALMQ